MSPATEPLTAESRSRVTIRTSLYELIDALNAVVEPGEAEMVAVIVKHWLETGRITFLGTLGHRN